jgi:hypothetical protein
MRTRFTALACLALAGATVAAAPAAEAKPGFGFKSAKFRIAVDGVQTTAWKTDHPIGTAACDVGYKGEGTEVVRFASKPLTVTATSYGVGEPRFQAGKKFGAVLEMPGKVTRRSDFKLWGNPCTDGDGRGGKAPVPPDCGQRKVTVDGEVKFVGGRLLVDRPASDFLPLPPYRNCHVEGTAFPELLWRGGKNAVGKPLSARKLFAGRKARAITVGRRDVYQDAEDWHETTLKYTVTLTRISKVKEF